MMMSHQPRHVLFLAEGQLGDLLLLTPAIRAFKNTYPKCGISLAIFHRRSPSAVDIGPGEVVVEGRGVGTAAVFADNPHVDQVINVFRFQMRGRRDLGRLRGEASVVRQIRRLKCDVVVCTFPEDRFAALAFLSGARIRVGQKRQALSWLLNRTPETERSAAGVLRYYCDLAIAAGADVRSMETEFHVPECAVQWAEEVLTRAGLTGESEVTGAHGTHGTRGIHGALVAVHPGASGDYKIWPPGRYAQLIEGLSSRAGTRVFVCRGDADGPIVDALLSRLTLSVPVLDTGTDLAKLGALFKKSDLCITNDSGPRHLAVAVGAPSLALFRRHHDREWSVYASTSRCRTLQGSDACPACPAGECRDLLPTGEPFGSWCMRMVTVEEVFSECEKMLSVG
jgi:ADP-heptose:LPS heptosyltransferase